MGDKKDFTSMPKEELAAMVTARVDKWAELFLASKFDEIKKLYYPTSLILPPDQGPARGPDGAVSSYGAAQAAGLAKVVRLNTEVDLLGPDKAVTYTNWEWFTKDDVKGGTIKDLTIWTYHEDNWVIYKEQFNSP